MSVEELRQRVEAMRNMNLTGLRERLELLHARVDLEAMAGTIARETDVDHEVVLLAVHASWTANLDGLIDETIDQDEFRECVEVATRKVVAALVAGRSQVGEPLVDAALSRTLQLGRQRQSPPSVADALAEVSRIVTGAR